MISTFESHEWISSSAGGDVRLFSRSINSPKVSDWASSGFVPRVSSVVICVDKLSTPGGITDDGVIKRPRVLICVSE